MIPIPNEHNMILYLPRFTHVSPSNTDEFQVVVDDF